MHPLLAFGILAQGPQDGNTLLMVGAFVLLAMFLVLMYFFFQFVRTRTQQSLLKHYNDKNDSHELK